MLLALPPESLVWGIVASQPQEPEQCLGWQSVDLGGKRKTHMTYTCIEYLLCTGPFTFAMSQCLCQLKLVLPFYRQDPRVSKCASASPQRCCAHHQACWLLAQRMPHNCPTAASPKHFRHSSVITSLLHQLAFPNAQILIAKCN